MNALTLATRPIGLIEGEDALPTKPERADTPEPVLNHDDVDEDVQDEAS